MPAQHRVVDTNVPLTAAGYNEVASDACRLKCIEFMEQLFRGEIVIVIDRGNEALAEYGNSVSRQQRSHDIAGRLLIHLFSNRGNNRFVREVSLERLAGNAYLDYPDNQGNWRTDDPKCKAFDEDDKKWVALALRFKQHTGLDAPIVNAADRCWLAFEPQLAAAGIKLETLCKDERSLAPHSKTN